MSDLIERLQRWGRTQKLECVPPEKLMDEAADEIERLTEELKMEEECYEALAADNEMLRDELEQQYARADALEVVAGYVSAGEYDSARLELAAIEQEIE